MQHLNKLPVFFGLLSMIFFFSCQKREFLKESGQLESFAEMVKNGVKPIAFGPQMTEAEARLFQQEAERISGKYGLDLALEADFPDTDLFSSSEIKGLRFFVLGTKNSLAAYESWKESVQQSMSSGSYSGEVRRSFSRILGRLLGYPTHRINDLLAENSNFRDLEDFGIQGTYLHWYYRDLDRAQAFYTQKLGLKVVEEKENQVILQLVGDSFLVLNALQGPDYSGEEPKSVALALLTDHLEAWYAHLEKENVTIKYALKIQDGGPHDGFVAVDPEGYLLEFETFHPHSENEVLIPELQGLAPLTTALGDEFTILGTITWLYYKDMLPAEKFVEESLGLVKSADQGWAKIYRMSSHGYLGLVDGLRGMNAYSPEKLVELQVDLENPGPWEN
ncbi:MAG: VOC family protein, partial [Cyclobacteriaceae bacterium]|nr:VOC family protein [Cyclobacteriaceae bacterium]MDX5467745.1 VOC family protein [Cyclobacteriaceae bacterium]